MLFQHFFPILALLASSLNSSAPFMSMSNHLSIISMKKLCHSIFLSNSFVEIKSHRSMHSRIFICSFIKQLSIEFIQFSSFSTSENFQNCFSQLNLPDNDVTTLIVNLQNVKEDQKVSIHCLATIPLAKFLHVVCRNCQTHLAVNPDQVVGSLQPVQLEAAGAPCCIRI